MKEYHKRKAYYRIIPCYYNPINDELWGRNWFWDFVLGIVLWVDVNILEVEGFSIHIEKDEDFN